LASCQRCTKVGRANLIRKVRIAGGQNSAILGRKAWKSKDFRDAAAAIGEIRLREAVVELLKLEVQLKTGRAGGRVL